MVEEVRLVHLLEQQPPRPVLQVETPTPEPTPLELIAEEVDKRVAVEPPADSRTTSEPSPLVSPV